MMLQRFTAARKDWNPCEDCGARWMSDPAPDAPAYPAAITFHPAGCASVRYGWIRNPLRIGGFVLEVSSRG